jgi:hypothetical protein
MPKISAARATRSSSPTVIQLPVLDVRNLRIKLIGDSPLISHKWAEKAKREMLGKQMKEAKQGKPIRNPEQEFLDSLYDHPNGGYGFPAVAFKSAAVNACSHIDGVTKVEARGAFHVNGDLVQIIGTPIMREDMVRIGQGVADLRYRAHFEEWSCELFLRYNAGVLSAEEIVNLFNTAGFGIGVGEWRPQKSGGQFGLFHVATSGE